MRLQQPQEYPENTIKIISNVKETQSEGSEHAQQTVQPKHLDLDQIMKQIRSVSDFSMFHLTGLNNNAESLSMWLLCRGLFWNNTVSLLDLCNCKPAEMH